MLGHRPPGGRERPIEGRLPAGFPGQPVEDSGAILREERFKRVAALAVAEPEAKRPGSPAEVGARHDDTAASCGEESVSPIRRRRHPQVERQPGRRAQLLGFSPKCCLQKPAPANIGRRRQLRQPCQPGRQPAEQVLPEQGVPEVPSTLPICVGSGGVEA